MFLLKLDNIYLIGGQKDFRSSVSANQFLGGGALNELSHEIDYAFWLFGDLQLKFSNLRQSEILKLDVEDCVDIVASTVDGKIINIHLDFLQKVPSRFIRVIGARKTIFYILLRIG